MRGRDTGHDTNFLVVILIRSRLVCAASVQDVLLHWAFALGADHILLYFPISTRKDKARAVLVSMVGLKSFC